MMAYNLHRFQNADLFQTSGCRCGFRVYYTLNIKCSLSNDIKKKIIIKMQYMYNTCSRAKKVKF